jgi:hypothetical protein
MHKGMLLVAAVLYTVALVPASGHPALDGAPIRDLEHASRHPAPHPVPWSPGAKNPDDWATIIDATWGDDVPPADQLAVFDAFWHEVDRRFACFHDIEDRWLDLRIQYVPEIVGGVSRGRLAGILGQLGLSLRESHTRLRDGIVHTTFAGRGIPLLHANALAGRAGDLGAAVTATADGTGLVYAVQPDNPLGLEPGDIILGYDGRAWSDCLAELLAAELPVTGWWGSCPSAWEHHWTAAVGANWHLFDTMDVVEHGTGETVHLPTAMVDGYSSDLYGSEQLDVGVPFPDVAAGEEVSWGTIERRDATIGYVYVFGWTGGAGEDFATALDELTSDPGLAGLIIDFRKNHGGNMFLSDPGLGLLFQSSPATIEWYARCSPSDHLALCSKDVWQTYVIDNDPPDRHYHGPIAVLTGPGAVSSGDQVALRLTYHPTTRFFGKSTAAAFNSPESEIVLPGFLMVTAPNESARVSAADQPLTHRELPVDETVWLRPDDVAQGRDTVVDAAAAWITGMMPVEDPGRPGTDTLPRPITAFLGAHPNPFNPTTELVFRLQRPGDGGELTIHDVAGRRVRSFPLRGLAAGEHGVTWDGRSDTGRALPSGTYLVRLDTPQRLDTGVVTLMK